MVEWKIKEQKNIYIRVVTQDNINYVCASVVEEYFKIGGYVNKLDCCICGRKMHE